MPLAGAAGGGDATGETSMNSINEVSDYELTTMIDAGGATMRKGETTIIVNVLTKTTRTDWKNY